MAATSRLTHRVDPSNVNVIIFMGKSFPFSPTSLLDLFPLELDSSFSPLPHPGVPYDFYNFLQGAARGCRNGGHCLVLVIQHGTLSAIPTKDLGLRQVMHAWCRNQGSCRRTLISEIMDGIPNLTCHSLPSAQLCDNCEDVNAPGRQLIDHGMQMPPCNKTIAQYIHSFSTPAYPPPPVMPSSQNPPPPYCASHLPHHPIPPAADPPPSDRHRVEDFVHNPYLAYSALRPPQC
ncbi:hypothetical protein NLI96_g1839 [Meripilus lineatus]|uniref:Uncharacterized protein n=1 Tax=Meripilus lineatus TaxID=2056292 RepID=A0AAD5VF78_9APHY|nr:hypothetical protein NLI96_g1839 [Physisporinus lineatus]